MDDQTLHPLPGVSVDIGTRLVHVRSAEPLTVLSSAVVGGGACVAREILNMHVDDQYDGRPDADLAALAQDVGAGAPFVGLMTAASTEYARCAVEKRDALTVAAVVSVGLSNTSSAGVTPPYTDAGDGESGAEEARARMPRPGTINVILLVDGALTPAAQVNAVITVTEAKTMTLRQWDVKTPEGDDASGTSTDTVVVACTGRGEESSYAGPATPVGWLAARAVRVAMTRICEEKIARDGGRVGW
jgi:adenosylcobinamide hydrolase